jgi:glutathione reductase (NADPH)
MTTFDYDLFVIGAGSGGVRAARIAATHGAKVAIAEEFRFGGTCVIRGCVPKKLLVYASRFRDEFEDARGFGWSVAETKFDWASLIAAKDKEIGRLEEIYRGNLVKAGVAVYAARAELADAHTIRIEGAPRPVTARRILIATGARPNLGETFKGRAFAITSNEAFDLPELPRRIVVVGGGYIAAEFACLFHGLGSETTLVYRGEKILRGFDDDLREGLSEALGKRGIRVVTGRKIAHIDREGGTLHASLDDGTVVGADQVMLAIGRSPNVEGLGLAAAGVAVGKNGAITVDKTGQTSVPSIFAVGDVTDQVNLTPVAIRQGHAFADTVYGNKPWATDLEHIPTAVFATPEIGTVGLTETAARQVCGKVDIYKTRFRPMKAILAGRDERMLMKLVVDGETDRVVGCHILGPDAAEIVQMAAIAMRMGARKADFDATMALHPSAAEELVTLREKWRPPGQG